MLESFSVVKDWRISPSRRLVSPRAVRGAESSCAHCSYYNHFTSCFVAWDNCVLKSEACASLSWRILAMLRLSPATTQQHRAVPSWSDLMWCDVIWSEEETLAAPEHRFCLTERLRSYLTLPRCLFTSLWIALITFNFSSRSSALGLTSSNKVIKGV